MWKELLIGLLLSGAGAALLWHQPASTKKPVRRIAANNARLTIKVHPAATFQIPKHPNLRATSFSMRHVIASPGGAVQVQLSRKFFVSKAIAWDGLTSREVSVKLVPDKRLPIVFFALKSKPTGALVYVGGKPFGMTPTTVVTQRDQSVTLRLVQPKHIPLRFVWKGQRDGQRMVVLKPVSPGNLTLPPTWSWAKPADVSVALAKATLAKGIKPGASDPRGNRMLHFAAFTTNLKLAKFLMQKKGEINARNLDGQTPLHIAFARAATNTARARYWPQTRFLGFLAEQGALPNALDRRAHTPLTSALWLMAQQKANVGWIQVKIFRWLLQRGGSLDAIDSEGKTPLHHAAFYGAGSLVKYLVKMKASLNLLDKQGRTPLDYAVKQGHFTVAALLKQRGAKRSK